MPDVLNVAITGLLAYQRALATTSHNITNVNTPGYSRQTANFVTAPSEYGGGFYFGTGVNIRGVSRAYNQFIGNELRESTSNFHQLEGYHDFAARLDSLLADDEGGISPSLQEFFRGMNILSDNPASQTARSNFLSQSNLLINRFSDVYSKIQGQNELMNQDIRSMVSDINSMAQSIANINARIMAANGTPADLQDTRDELLKELSKLVNITVTEQTDGAVNVFVGAGQPLIAGNQINTFVVSPSLADASVLSIGLKNSTNGTVDITESITGGKLGGLFNYRDEVMTPAVNSLGRLAIALSTTFNEQHHLGMDLNGNLGGDFFIDMNDATISTDRVIPHSLNGGTAVLSAAISDVNALTTSDYALTVTAGPNYIVTRLSDNTSTTFAGFPITIDGFTLSVASGATAVGDNFIIAPTRFAANDLALEINSTSQIALASPIRTSASTNNTGSASISVGSVLDTGTTAFTTTPGALSPPIRIEFLSATTYRLVNATTSIVMEGPLAYNPNQTNQIFPTAGAYDPGYRVSLSGPAQTGDVFNIQYNTGGTGDNRNALQLAALATTKIMEGGTATLQDAYVGMVADVGLKTRESEVNMNVNEMLLKRAQDSRDTVSGVNLDEEAADMLKLQQNYQAAAQLISIAQRMFDTIIGTFA